MTLSDRIITYILKHHPLTLDRLIEVAVKKGFTEDEVLVAMERVHSDRRILQTSTQAGEVTYRPAAVKRDTGPGAHVTWVKNNYPAYIPGYNDGSGIEAEFSHLFLSPSEMKEYKMQLKGGYAGQRRRQKE